jgi:hypothetical protein
MPEHDKGLNRNKAFAKKAGIPKLKSKISLSIPGRGQGEGEDQGWVLIPDSKQKSVKV